jgi:hypothetical protein
VAFAPNAPETRRASVSFLISCLTY